MPDPDFSEALLLEQYQAQISSALAPAFGAESSPELACAAVNVCATFIATGLVTDVDRMGRILKLLVSSLDSLIGGCFDLFLLTVIITVQQTMTTIRRLAICEV